MFTRPNTRSTHSRNFLGLCAASCIFAGITTNNAINAQEAPFVVNVGPLAPAAGVGDGEDGETDGHGGR